ncbi:hypothetical protein [Agromyces albus]|uniref:hypothetical protein n=1 Tax=Agromyces albus TaxID=205332 RepID=UPI0027880F81|nr:hypothetical protein [Agromyces albus]MDQ0574944.1 hypothetical protein [Agromyces albus]
MADGDAVGSLRMPPEDSFGLRVDGGVRGAVGRSPAALTIGNPKETLMSIRRTLAVLATAAALTLVAASPALAASPHFVSASASATGATLTVKFKEAGLGANQEIVYEAKATLNADYGCVNKGGNRPSDPKKTHIEQDVTETDTFSSGKNGQITASITLSAPTASEVLSCPPGQTATTFLVEWTNVSITDTTNNVKRDIPGTF